MNLKNEYQKEKNNSEPKNKWVTPQLIPISNLINGIGDSGPDAGDLES